MAKPRIFISSTYFDLRNIRSDLDRYIKERNYEPILNEKGHIAYSSQARLEEYCYKEIENCDILISIIGGRFGSTAFESGGYSISQKELRTALEKGKQVYIFIEKAVLHEYRTYEHNKENSDIISMMKFSAVDDLKVYQFLDEVFALPINNQYTGFETSNDIVQYLQEQWASLFHSLLSDAAKQKDVKIIEELKDTAKTLKQLVSYLTSEKEKGNEAIREILFSNHPVFSIIQNAIGTNIRVYFTNLDELKNLMDAFGYHYLDGLFDSDTYFEWRYSNKIIKVSKKIFLDDMKLKPMNVNDWDNELVLITSLKAQQHELDDDLPF
ncbi:DUF4062 domain-containing protein [Acinetobacter beijerinckii]|uniref:DUF4062 domain-containing protein n=1 Tax=Acinetobacter beijerinckii CIP 110307 TaxID=1217648 RepID=N9EBL5_9GAMM|nr:DUF4062 domain-containing protein [Acinetobacter beijerinckii]ENW07597.1 hypothetical protein F933_00793 [Acinetobacter beijerinckii CIP 110307]